MSNPSESLFPSRDSTWLKAALLFGGSLGLILLLFLTQMVVSLRKDLVSLERTLATKSELANLAVSLGPSDPARVGLEGTCTDCHDISAFRDSHQLDNVEVEQVVEQMSQLAGASISPAEIPRAEAALTFLKCAHCHTIDRLKELAILEPLDRWNVILSMMAAPGAQISQDDARRIRDFYGDFWGWHRP
ncbi:MAG: hypothetical protein MUO50_11130 [Longimicrobiales bacterium]|nr:hypothetical protein [Longimicrobiales bacterium]